MKIKDILESEIKIDESLGNLKGIPAAWVKSLTWAGAGENSEIVSNDKPIKIKKFSQFKSVIRNALDAVPTKTYGDNESSIAGIYLTLNNAPLCILNKVSYAEKYNIKAADGEHIKVVDYKKTRDSGKYFGRGDNKYYVPVRYANVPRTDLSKREAIEQIGALVLSLGNGESFDDDFFGSNDIDVIIIKRDESRSALKTARLAARAGADSDILANKKETLKKYIKGQIQSIINEIDAEIKMTITSFDIEKLMTDALDGKAPPKRNIDFNNLAAKLKLVSELANDISNVMGKDIIKFSEKNWQTGNQKQSSNIRFINLYIKMILDEN